MSMRRPRIKPQVNLASTRRRPNAAATTKPAVAAAATTTSSTTTTTTSDATKSDTQHDDVNEENATNATQQLADKPPETTTTTLESNNEENQVQVSVIDYNVPTEDAISSTTEYVVTIKNEPETSPIKPATKSPLKKPAFKKIKPNLIRTSRKPKEKIEKNDTTTEADSTVQDEKEGGKPTEQLEEVNFKVPTTVAQESETQLANPSTDVLQKDMQREAEEPRTPLREEAAKEAEEGRLNGKNGENGEYGEIAASATLENVDIHPIKSPHPEYLHMSTSLPSSPIPHPNRPFFPAGSRLRTESSCSVFSESLASTGTQKATRRIDEQKRQQRAQARKIFANGPPDKTVMKMSDLIYYNPPTKPMDIKSLPPPQAAKDPKTSLAETENDKEEEPPAPPQKSIVPQLKLNAAGELVLDDTSLEIETTAEQQAKKTLANSSLIYVDEYTGMNGFYKRRPRTREWPREETVKFYRCLQVIGTDFSCMLQLFPNRTRRDLKLKFKKEERVNGQLINKAILNPKTFNVEDLKTQLENEEKERQENEKKWKEFMAKNPKPKKVKDGKSVGGRVLKHGDHIYETEKKQVESTNKRKRTYKKQVQKAASDENSSEVGNDAQAPPKEVKPKADTNRNEPEKPKTRKRKQKKTDENANMENVDTNPEVTKQAEIESEIPKKRRRGRPKADPKDNSLVPVQLIKVELQNTQTTSADAAAKENGNENGEGTLDRAELEAELDTLTANEAENGEEHLKQSVAETKVSTKDESAHLQKKELHESLGIKNDTLQLDSINIDSDDDDDSNSAQDAVSLLFALGAPKSPPKPSPPTPRQTYCELGEEEIASILRQIAEGSMALVSTLDPTDPDKVLNEIYAIDQDTGELSNEPLNVPDELVQSILEVMS